MPYWHIDTGMAALLILQTAVDEGLGACFFGIPPEQMDAFRDAFGVPAAYTPIGAVTVGHRVSDPGAAGSADPAPAPRTRRRRPPRQVGRAGLTPPQSIGPPAPGQRPHAARDLGSETR